MKHLFFYVLFKMPIVENDIVILSIKKINLIKILLNRYLNQKDIFL